MPLFRRTQCTAPDPPPRIVTYTSPGGTVQTLSLEILNAEHALFAGTTGAGKSVLLNTVLTDAHRAEPPGSAQFIYIDFKRIELKKWQPCPHCIGYATDAETARSALKWAVDTMERRYYNMDITGRSSCNDTHIYIVIDELALLLQDAPDTLDTLAHLGRLARAANIHIIAATQAPNRKSLPAALAQNFTCAVALRCRSAIESRQIIGISGAEKLPRYGSGILWNKDGYRNVNIKMTEERETQQIIDYWRKQKMKEKRAFCVQLKGHQNLDKTKQIK